MAASTGQLDLVAGPSSRDEGAYSFRQWSTQLTAPQTGAMPLLVRCTNTKEEVQPAEANWNGGGFMRNVIERVQLRVA
jgi:hypothetical protein